MPRIRDRCDSVMLDEIAECGRNVHTKCTQKKQKAKHPSEMKGSCIKHTLASICCKKGVETNRMTWNELLEDDKEYLICSSFYYHVKKEEKDLEKKKEEKERKRKREEQQTSQLRCSLQTQGLPPEQFYLLADVVDDDKKKTNNMMKNCQQRKAGLERKQISRSYIII